MRTAVSARPGIVALPAFSCYDIVSAAVGAGVRAVFYDLDPKTLGFDLESLERALQAGATVIVAAPLYGLPWDWDRLRSLATRTGALLVEDAAQGHGAEWRGRPLGSLGDLSVLSFGRGKGWTGGAGGALLIRDRSIAAAALPVDGPGPDAVAVLRAAAQWLFGHPSLYGIPHALPFLALGESRYHPPTAVKPMGAGTATMILASRGVADAEVAVRRRRAEGYRDRLEASGIGLVYTPAAGAAPGWLRYPVLRPPPTGRGNALTRAELRLGIAPSYPLALPDLPAARELGDAAAERFPGAMELATGLLTLPTHSWIGDRQASRVVRVLSAASRVR